MLTNEVKELLLKYGTDSCTPEEKQFIEEWFRKQQETGNLSADGKDDKQIIRELLESGLQQKSQRRFNKISYRRKRNGWVYGSAILIVAALAYWFFIRQPVDTSRVVAPATVVATDILAPRNNRSLLTLADGNILSLHSAAGNEITRQGNTRITRTAGGEIQYKPVLPGAQVAKHFNMLYNPKGSRVAKLTLSDGSRVWLNCESSVRYPVEFSGTERKVEITGEAYFEVARDPSRKFIVSGTDLSVEVAGTRFHINNYLDEISKKVTVMEGTVRVIPSFGKQNARILKPGEQVQVNHATLLQTATDFNPEKTMAWRNDEFVFEKDDLRHIMLQLSRWYDIQPVFRTTDHTQYTARISRHVPLSAVLALLEKNGTVKFEITGKDVFIVATTTNGPVPAEANPAGN